MSMEYYNCCGMIDTDFRECECSHKDHVCKGQDCPICTELSNQDVS